MSEQKELVSTWLPRLALIGSGAILCFAGIFGTLNPEIISGSAKLEPDAVTSIRVDFGGFHLGLGLFALFGAIFGSLTRASLIAVLTTLLLVVSTRMLGLVLDGVNETQLTTLAKESIPLALSTIGLSAYKP